MTEFVRSPEYLRQIFLDSLDREVVFDAKVQCVPAQGKLKVWCGEVNAYLQFPKKLRAWNREYIVDIVRARNSTGRVFYRAYKGSIRDKFGNMIA